MKKITLLIVCILMAFGSVLSEAVHEDLVCICGLEECICFAKEGDSGYLIEAARNALIEAGYLGKAHPKATFDGDMKAALTAFQRDKGIEETGVLDDATLLMLIAPDAETEVPQEKCFYVPVKGGNELHLSAVCSGMKEPRIVSAHIAARLYAGGHADWCDVCCRRLINN